MGSYVRHHRCWSDGFHDVKEQEESPHACFRGLNEPNQHCFAIAKLRRELADESSITLSDVNCVRMSPLIVLPDGLVQIAMIKQAWMDNQRLWVPEAARAWWHWERKQTDDITGFWEELQSARGDDLRKALERHADAHIESKGSSCYSAVYARALILSVARLRFRHIANIMPIINNMKEQRSLRSDVACLGLDTTSRRTAEFVALMRCKELRPLWECAMEPWPQLVK